MPSLTTTANDTAQQIAAERENACHYVRSIVVDNDLGGGDRIITIQDVFTTSKTPAAAAAAKDICRWQRTVPQGFIDSFDEKDLKGVKCLGALKVKSNVADSSCHITVGYQTK